MNNILKDVATAMSDELTKIFESNIKVPRSAIVKLPAWDNYTKETIYVCQYQGYLVMAYVENNIIAEVGFVR